MAKKKYSETGNWTPVSRVTGGDTHHYTISDYIDLLRIRPVNHKIFFRISACFPFNWYFISFFTFPIQTFVTYSKLKNFKFKHEINFTILKFFLSFSTIIKINVYKVLLYEKKRNNKPVRVNIYNRYMYWILKKIPHSTTTTMYACSLQ